MEFTGCRLIYYRKKGAEFKLYDVADQHFTNIGVAWDIVHRDIRLIKENPYALWVEGGDFADWHLPGHPYFDAEAFPENFSVRKLADYAGYVTGEIIDLYSPIAEKCLGWAYGNHDHNFFTRASQKGIQDRIVSELGVQNLRYSGWMKIFFIHETTLRSEVKVIQSSQAPKEYTACITTVVHHGKGAAASVGGKMNSLRDIVSIVDADLVMTSHLHEQLAKPFTRIMPNVNCTEAVAKTCMALITGTYLRNYQPNHTSYGEKKAYAPTTLGATCARYIPSERTMIVELRADNVGCEG